MWCLLMFVIDYTRFYYFFNYTIYKYSPVFLKYSFAPALSLCCISSWCYWIHVTPLPWFHRFFLHHGWGAGISDSSHAETCDGCWVDQWTIGNDGVGWVKRWKHQVGTHKTSYLGKAWKWHGWEMVRDGIDRHGSGWTFERVIVIL